MTTPKPLSPAAQAVWAAFRPTSHTRVALAAALRALVENHGISTSAGTVILNGNDVLAIATELEGSNA